MTGSLIGRLLKTEDDYAALAIRIGLGLVIIPHGAQKLFGWFGGYGFSGTMGFFTDQMGIPWIFAFLAIVAESFGALGLIVGGLTRVAALGVGSVMLVAATTHVENGFFMNWFGQQAGEGFEFHLLAIAMAAALVLRGGGSWSLDQFVAARVQ